MRDYGKVSPLFWIGKTGKALRGHPEAQIVAVYLMTCPTSEMTGVFHCPLMYIAHETGLGDEGALKGLARLYELDFCTFEADTDIMFVHEMAKYQISDNLKASDNQVKGVKKAYTNMPHGLIRRGFYDRYKDSFHLDPEDKKGTPSEAPPKPLASQEQEQEQAQEQEQSTNPIGLVADSGAADLLGKPAKPDCPHKEIIALYHEVLPMCPQVRDWTPARATQLRARWNEDATRQDLAYWRRLFEYIKTCDFLVGKAGKEPFFADLEWITKSANFTKIREAKYENRRAA